MTYKIESLVSDEKARAILASVDALDEFIEGQDYYLCEDEDGGEFLHAWGDDEPCAENGTNTSWSSPDYPPWVEEESA